MSGWNLPPGVSGNEPQIAGYPDCGACGHASEHHYADEDPESGCMVDRCPCSIYTPDYGDGGYL